MKAIQISAVLFALATAPIAALADRDKDESGHGKHRHGRHEYKQEFWDGNCKVEIKQKNGDYKEERKCRGPQHVHAPAPVYVVPQPVVVAPQPVYVPAPRGVEPSVTIRATIPIK
jgi:hypothetical protein